MKTHLPKKGEATMARLAVGQKTSSGKRNVTSSGGRGRTLVSSCGVMRVFNWNRRDG